MTGHDTEWAARKEPVKAQDAAARIPSGELTDISRGAHLMYVASATRWSNKPCWRRGRTRRCDRATAHRSAGDGPGPLRDELNDGAALWPHYSQDGHPDLILASAGDIPARELSTAATRLRTTHPQVALRYLHVNDLAALGTALPNALSGASFARLFATHTPVLMAVPTYPGTVHALLAARGPADRFHVAGYQEPRRPTSPEGLLQHCGLSASALYNQATRMIKEHIR